MSWIYPVWVIEQKHKNKVYYYKGTSDNQRIWTSNIEEAVVIADHDTMVNIWQKIGSVGEIVLEYI